MISPSGELGWWPSDCKADGAPTRVGAILNGEVNRTKFTQCCGSFTSDSTQFCEVLESDPPKITNGAQNDGCACRLMGALAPLF